MSDLSVDSNRSFREVYHNSVLDAHVCWSLCSTPDNGCTLCKEYAMISSNLQKSLCVKIPSAADTPQDSCWGPKGSHSVAGSAPVAVWSSRRTVPVEQRQLCRQEQTLTKATFIALIKAKPVCQPNVASKCSCCAQPATYCQEISFTVQAFPFR